MCKNVHCILHYVSTYMYSCQCAGDLMKVMRSSCSFGVVLLVVVIIGDDDSSRSGEKNVSDLSSDARGSVSVADGPST